MAVIDIRKQEKPTTVVFAEKTLTNLTETAQAYQLVIGHTGHSGVAIFDTEGYVLVGTLENAENLIKALHYAIDKGVFK